MMRANYIHLDAHLRRVLDAGVAGDLAELGVWHGTTFMPMAELARINGRVIHAVDSFVGMAAPTARDGRGYRANALSVGGSRIFRELVKPFGRTVRIHEGFVPAVLAEIEDCRFAFVHLDLDQYAPTLAALAFLWPRMSPGGVLMCHDWDPAKITLASGAIREWMARSGVEIAGAQESGHCWFVKDRTDPSDPTDRLAIERIRHARAEVSA